MQEPKIVYRTVTLNGKNIAPFLRIHKKETYDANRNHIILYNYIIGKDLDPKQVKRAKSIIKGIELDRPCTIAHERHHWQNRVLVPDPSEFANNNYYQETYLYCLDEISAFTAGEFYSCPPLFENGACAETIAIAMHASVSYFIEGPGCTHYIHNIIKFMRNSILDDLKQSNITLTDLINLQRNFHNNPDAMFNDRFQDAVKKYFTFDGYSIMNEKLSGQTLKMLDSIQNMCEQIKFEYLTKLDETISRIISDRRIK